MLSFTCQYAVIIFFRKYLRETLKVANSEDLNRLTACSLVLLGNTFLSQGITQVMLQSTSMTFPQLKRRNLLLV